MPAEYKPSVELPDDNACAMTGTGLWVYDALRNEIDLERCIIYTSGRVPLEIVKKAIRVRIPILAAKAAPTNEAVRLAWENGLTLIVSARRDSMRIYFGKESCCGKNGEYIQEVIPGD